ncbi:O-antigen ligase family protein [Spirochaetota bacterium]
MNFIKNLTIHKIIDYLIKAGFFIFFCSLPVSQSGIEIGKGVLIAAFILWLIFVKSKSRIEMKSIFNVLLLLFIVQIIISSIFTSIPKETLKKIPTIYSQLLLVFLFIELSEHHALKRFIFIMLLIASLHGIYIFSVYMIRHSRSGGFLGYATSVAHFYSACYVITYVLIIYYFKRLRACKTKRSLAEFLCYLFFYCANLLGLAATESKLVIFMSLVLSVILFFFLFKNKKVLLLFIAAVIAAFAVLLKMNADRYAEVFGISFIDKVKLKKIELTEDTGGKYLLSYFFMPVRKLHDDYSINMELHAEDTGEIYKYNKLIDPPTGTWENGMQVKSTFSMQIKPGKYLLKAFLYNAKGKWNTILEVPIALEKNNFKNNVYSVDVNSETYRYITERKLSFTDKLLHLKIRLRLVYGQRRYFYRTSWHIAAHFPLTGAGQGNWKKYFYDKVYNENLDYKYLESRHFHAHNNFLNLIAEAGYAAGFLLILLVLYIIVYSLYIYFKYPHTVYEVRVYYIMFIFAFIGINIEGMIDYTVFNGFSGNIFWMLIGIIVYYHRVILSGKDLRELL